MPMRNEPRSVQWLPRLRRGMWWWVIVVLSGLLRLTTDALAVVSDENALIIDSINFETEKVMVQRGGQNEKTARNDTQLRQRKIGVAKELAKMGWRDEKSRESAPSRDLGHTLEVESSSCSGAESFAPFRAPKQQDGNSACTLFAPHVSKQSCTCRSVLRDLTRKSTTAPIERMREMISSLCCRPIPTPAPPRTTIKMPMTRPLGDSINGPPLVTIPPNLGTDKIPVVPWPQKCNRFRNGKCAPAVIIAGAKKCGTNSVASMLKLHPYAKFKG